MTISSLTGREVLDSRGNPTVEAQVGLSNGTSFHAIVPSGASTGTYEALELRDKDPARYSGNGVLTAVNNVDQVIAPAVIGRSPFDQGAIDTLLIELDGDPGKTNLGANAILAVSMAVAQAAASLDGEGSLWRHLCRGGPVSLPVPMFNILNGGKHASNSTDIQEFMVLPVGAETFSQALRTGVEIYQSLKNLLRSEGQNLNVGDEGGFAPSLPSNKDAIQLVLQAIQTAGYKPGQDIYLGLDVAASELFDKESGKYVLEREGASLTSEEMVDLYQQWTRDYPILSIEDGLDEDDWDGWQELCRRLGDTVQLVGDDLLVTNIQRIQRGVDEKASNSVLLKPNQIGTLSETLAACNLAREAGWGTVMSHRSGETEDTTIADLAVGWDVRQIKTGAPARSERVAKYNRLLRIESELGKDAHYAGSGAYQFLHPS
ncbi:MAG: phosphopyruvate hydratase [SAR202 cluster bacterium Io17-Chloro-G4]|nr:MAG: phosphopyruvate hydratase [SAR202 cluster bacterium Io17-Chloro-G4]